MLTSSEADTLCATVQRKHSRELITLALHRHFATLLLHHYAIANSIDFQRQFEAGERCYAARARELGADMHELQEAQDAILKAGSTAQYLHILPE